MIRPGRSCRTVRCAAVLAATALSACDQGPPPDREPPGPRAEGPVVDPDILANDPAVAAFREEAARYLELARQLAPLEVALAEETISEADTERWRELDAERTSERSRLNRFMYADGTTREQRAAMWWVLQGGPPPTGE